MTLDLLGFLIIAATVCLAAAVLARIGTWWEDR